MRYRGIAKTKDGKEYKAEGTMTELANWADNVIRVTLCEEIRISEIKEKTDEKTCIDSENT